MSRNPGSVMVQKNAMFVMKTVSVPRTGQVHTPVWGGDSVGCTQGTVAETWPLPPQPIRADQPIRRPRQFSSWTSRFSEPSKTLLEPRFLHIQLLYQIFESKCFDNDFFERKTLEIGFSNTLENFTTGFSRSGSRNISRSPHVTNRGLKW